MKHKRIAGAGAGLVVIGVLIAGILAPSAQADTIFGSRAPTVAADSDQDSVELGVKFSASTNGTISAIRYYKSAENTGAHVGSLWTGSGRKLATVAFEDESASGWQTAELDTPIPVRAGATYVASYLAPSGRYAGDTHGFDQSLTRGALTVPAGGGVYAYGSGGFPTNNWQNSNYYVDVAFTATGGAVPAVPGNETGATPTSAPTTASPTPSPSPSATSPTAAPTTASPTAAPTTSSPTSSILDLPKIPWEGADYWKQFAKADKAGWDDPSFFPIANWWSVADTKEEVAFDKSMGLNTYVLTNENADYRLIESGGMYWVGGKLPNATDASPNWVGSFLDDEVDGRFTNSEGFAHLKSLSDANNPATTGRFRYANYTSSLVTYDRDAASRNQYVNGYTDAVSLDQYFYSLGQCDWPANALRWNTPLGQTAVNKSNCRTSSSYGKMVDLMRAADATDGKLQSIWNFVEVVGDEYKLDGDKVQGAAMSSVIHGARGIIWFPQSFTGNCGTGNAFRTYEQENKPACLKAQVEGAQKVNLFIKSLAPVLNTQSYQYDFGTGIDSMLKTYNGSAYVFAMGEDGGTGARTFTLPAGVAGTQVEVVGENRSLSVSGGKFTDSFAKESSYHVYKISLTS